MWHIFKRYIAGLALVGFVLLLALVPNRTESKSRTRGARPGSSKSTVAGKKQSSKPLLDLLSPEYRASLKKADAAEEKEGENDDPDLPSKKFMRGRIVDKEEYNRLRDEYFGLLRGIDPSRPLDPRLRGIAIRKLEQQESVLRKTAEKSRGGNQALAFADWIELGPRPIPNGQSQQFPTPTVTTGRATAVVVDPTNSNNVYLGTAQGGVWRSTNGGTSWISIFDGAVSQAIGAIAVAPS